MTDEEILELRNGFMTIVPPEYYTLYSGTHDLEFAVGLAQRFGWHSVQSFRARYCGQSLGGTAIYGPGIYLTDVRREAEGYGPNLLEFTFNKYADYLDLANPAISREVVRKFGGGKQKLLAEPKIDALIRVTANYFVLRTPDLVKVHLH